MKLKGFIEINPINRQTEEWSIAVSAIMEVMPTAEGHAHIILRDTEDVLATQTYTEVCILIEEAMRECNVFVDIDKMTGRTERK